MKSNYLKLSLLYLLIISACSLPPEKKITLDQLQRSELAYYEIKESMESVLNELNTKGEVVVTSKEGKKEVLIKIYATSDKGLIIKQFQQEQDP